MNSTAGRYPKTAQTTASSFALSVSHAYCATRKITSVEQAQASTPTATFATFTPRTLAP